MNVVLNYPIIIRDIIINYLYDRRKRLHDLLLTLINKESDFELIEDTKLRAKLEARNLLMGRDLILETQNIDTVAKLITLAQDYNSKDVL